MAHHTFISYAHENSRFAKKLAGALRQYDIEVWLDQRAETEDGAWETVMRQAILGCDRFLLILSPAAVASWLVRAQFLQAQRQGKSIIFLLHQPCHWPDQPQIEPPVDFVNHSFDVGLRHLLRRHFPETHATLAYRPAPLLNWPHLKHRWLEWLAPWSGLRKFTASILLMLLFLSTIFFWPSDADELAVPNDPRLERLAVIPTATPLPFNRPLDGKPMAYIPSGEFLMGSAESDPLAGEDEMPQRVVEVDAFWMDQTEVTNREYGLCVEAGACTPADHLGRRFAGPDYPAIGVDWFQATVYCEWVGGRLPTEAEWEKAARGPEGRLYPWGNRFDGDRLNYCDRNCIQDWRDLKMDDGYKHTAPVGSYPRGASSYGLLDMSGNVWEWTADWYAPDTYQVATNQNPTGPKIGQQRVVRGGSWGYTGRNLRTTQRHKELPSFRYEETGFRCVMDEGAVQE